MSLVEIRIEQVRLPPNVPAGMNYLKLGHMAYMMRATNEHFDPIEVAALPDGSYRVVDGRHRFIASLIAGRPCIRAEVVE